MLIVLVVVFIAVARFIHAILVVLTRNAGLVPRFSVSRRLHTLPSNSRKHCTQMDFPEPNVPISIVEFQAVILAGYGNALAPLTNDHGDSPSPKALLPIANKPMISFPLTWLEEAGLTNVLLICPHSHRSAIAHFVHSDISSSSFSSLRIDIQTYEDDEAVSLGPCAILRRFASRIQTDFVLLPCDFVPPSTLPLSTVLNNYRADTEGMVISTLFYEVKEEDKSLEDSTTPPLVVYDRKSGTLLHVDYSDDTEKDELELHMRLLWKYPNSRITTRLADSHVYVCRRSILAVLAAKPALESIREDLIPFLCKIQYRKGKRFRWEPVLNQVTNISFPIHHPPSRSSSSWRSATTSRASSAPASPLPSERARATQSSLRCGVAVHALEQGIAARVNNIKAYIDLNRLSLEEGSSRLTSTLSSEHIDVKAQVSADSIIGSSTRVGERASIKKSVVGQHCVIGKNVRISGSVLMDHVVIEDGARIDGCILSGSTRVGCKAELTKSITQPGYEIPDEATIKGEKLDMADWDPRTIEEDELSNH